jgi:uncharacterized membrane protein YfcA
VHIDLPVTVAGLVVGVLVGLTGMGGGALLTPLLVLVFRVNPLAAISSDLLTSLVMKPVGATVHARRGTVNWRLVGWLSAGAVPAGFAGAVVIGMFGHGAGVTDPLTTIIGIALCAAVATTVFRLVMDRRAERRAQAEGAPPVRPLVTLAIGVVGGFAVGLTSVGAGSLIIAMLLVAYPGLRPAHLVGTDIMQAIPLVAAATLGHLIFGDVQLALTASLLVGALPGVYLGARLSAHGPGAFLRPVVTAVLLASALALLDVGPVGIVLGTVAALVVTTLLSRTRSTGSPAVADRTPTPAGRA